MALEIIEIALDQILLNDTNPRGFTDPETVKTISLSMATEGQKTEIKVRRVENGQYRVVGGDHRVLAARMLGWATIRATVLEIAPGQVYLEGYLDNRGQPMTWFANYWAVEATKAQSTDPKITQVVIANKLMLPPQYVSRALKLMPLLNPAAREAIHQNLMNSDKYKVTENPVFRLTELATGQPDDPDRLWAALKVVMDGKMTDPQVQQLVKWVKAGNPPETFGSAPKAPKQPKPKSTSDLTPEAVDQLVDLAEQVGLAKGRGEDPLPAQDKLKAFRESLSVPGQSQSSVKEPSYPIFHPKGFALLCRKIAEEAKAIFKTDPETEPVIEKEVQANGGSSAQPYHAPKMKWFKKLGKKLVELPWKEFGKIEHQTARKLAHAIVPLRPSNRGHHNSGLGQQFATLFLTILHWAIYCLLQFGFWWFVLTGLASWMVPGLKPWVAWPFRFAAHLVIYDFPAWAWANFHSHFGPTLFIGAVLLIGLYYTCKAEPLRMSLLGIALAYLMFQARGWAVPSAPWSEPVASETPAVSVPTAVIQPVRSSELEVRSSSLKTPNSKLRTANSTPAASYQPAVSFAPPAAPEQTLYDAKLLEQEIAALPKNCVVKAFPVLTDEGMPGDLAVSRSQGVTDPDKYTLIIDGDKKVIVNIATTTTNLIINYKSADPLNLDGAGQLNHFWEDVLYIHTDEIEVEGTTPYQFYQCSLVVSGAKHAMTIQCASADDLKHLVSALQYFIRNSRLSPSLGGLGHDTALAGMPYPYQGLVLNNDGVVDKLWADSLMDKAAVSLGDHFWSIGKVAFQRQSRSDLEAGLKTLPVTVFVASASEWDRAMKARTNVANSFRPRLRKITLEVGK